MKKRGSVFIEEGILDRIDQVYYKLKTQGLKITKSDMQESWIEDGLELVEEELKKEA